VKIDLKLLDRAGREQPLPHVLHRTVDHPQQLGLARHRAELVDAGKILRRHPSVSALIAAENGGKPRHVVHHSFGLRPGKNSFAQNTLCRHVADLRAVDGDCVGEAGQLPHLLRHRVKEPAGDGHQQHAGLLRQRERLARFWGDGFVVF